jgi:hypothetical protein
LVVQCTAGAALVVDAFEVLDVPVAADELVVEDRGAAVVGATVAVVPAVVATPGVVVTSGVGGTDDTGTWDVVAVATVLDPPGSVPSRGKVNGVIPPAGPASAPAGLTAVVVGARAARWPPPEHPAAPRAQHARPASRRRHGRAGPGVTSGGPGPVTAAGIAPCRR